MGYICTVNSPSINYLLMVIDQSVKRIFLNKDIFLHYICAQKLPIISITSLFKNSIMSMHDIILYAYTATNLSLFRSSVFSFCVGLVCITEPGYVL